MKESAKMIRQLGELLHRLDIVSQQEFTKMVADEMKESLQNAFNQAMALCRDKPATLNDKDMYKIAQEMFKNMR